MVEVEENEYMLPHQRFLRLAGRLVNWSWFQKKTGSGGSRGASEKGKRRRESGIPVISRVRRRAPKSTHLASWRATTHSATP